MSEKAQEELSEFDRRYVNQLKKDTELFKIVSQILVDVTALKTAFVRQADQTGKIFELLKDTMDRVDRLEGKSNG